MEYLLGKPVAEELKKSIISKINTFPRPPHLVILLNEEDLSSCGYANSLKKTAMQVGINIDIVAMKQEEEVYLQELDKLNIDSGVDAVLITRPLNKSLDENRIISRLNYKKDVDGINHLALGNIIVGKEKIVPNTSMAIIKMLDYYKIELAGKKVLVVGRSLSVGKPLAMQLLNRNATVTIAHSRTNNLDDELKNYDIVIGAVGKPLLLKGKYFKEGAIAIDAGIHYLPQGIVGDIEQDDKLLYISKVPGGVGPITSICLMNNVITCYEENVNGKE